MKFIRRLFYAASIILLLSLNNPPIWHNSLYSSEGQVTPSKSWGVFFDTTGHIEFTINHSGLAVRILIPSEFLWGFGENDTSFLNSTITNDRYYYKVIDESLHYPYEEHDPFRIEIHSPGYTTFDPPQKVFFKDIDAPRIAGNYTVTIYTATTLTMTGQPDFSAAVNENMTIPVSMREDPSSISGILVDISDEDPPITSEGLVTAREVNTGALARSFVNASTGFFNITGLYEGDYILTAIAGYLNITSHSYSETEFREIINVSRGTHYHIGSFPLHRGARICGNITYLNASSTPGFSMRSIDDNSWFSRLGINKLNYTVELYDIENDKIAGEYNGICQGDKNWDSFVITGMKYSGIGPGRYKLRAWVAGYVQEKEIPITVTTHEEQYDRIIHLKSGGVITGVIKLPQSPRQLENLITGNDTGALFGGNILAEAYDIYGELKGLCIMNHTFANETVDYADENEVRFYILGFSDFYNQTYSGVWKKRDCGLRDGQYYVRVYLNGFIQKGDEPVTVSLGHNSTLSIECLIGGVVKMFIESVSQIEGTPHANRIPWVFPGRFMRVWLDDSSHIGKEENFDLRTEDITLIYPTTTYWHKVEQSNLTIWYVGNNWSTDQIMSYGAIPNALSNGTYNIKPYTYGYVEVIGSNVTVELATTFMLGDEPRVVKGMVWLQRGAGVEGYLYFMQNYINVPLTERVSITIDIETTSGLVKGSQIGIAEIGAKYSEFSIYGFYSWKPSGYQLPDHFYYILPSGDRIRDYGLEYGTYYVRVNEFGSESRYIQLVETKITLGSFQEIKDMYIEVEKMVLAYGNVFGYSMRKDLIPLSWVRVASSERSTPSLDGQFKLFVTDGIHDLDFSIPGYIPEGRIVTIYNASSMEVNLFQSGTPFLTSYSEQPQNLFTIFVNQAITKNESIDYIISSKVDFALIDPESVQIEWSSDKGTLNSTKGSCVYWSIPNEISSENCSITSRASISEYDIVERKLVLNPANVPEFSTMALTTFVFILSITIALSSVRRKEYI